MPVKRKGPPRGAAEGGKPAKSAKSSRLSTPAVSTPQSIDSNDEFSENDQFDEVMEERIEINLDKFSIETYTKGRPVATGALARLFTDKKTGVNSDYSYLALKPDYINRPLWIDPGSGIIICENFGNTREQVKDFLITIAEPQSRTRNIHEYLLTTHSLYAAVSVGLSGRDIMNTLDRFLKVSLPDSTRQFIHDCTQSYGKVKLVLKNTKYFVESTDPDVLQMLLKDEIIGPLRVHSSDEAITTTAAPKMTGVIIPGTNNAAGLQAAGLAGEAAQKKDGEKVAEGAVYDTLNEDDDDEQEVTHAFEIPDSAVETVQKRCLDIEYPVLEEYDFRRDEFNPNLEIDLKPGTQIRRYQEASLSKMFGNGRAKSGLIVLPCGAGKTLVGITAACTIKKGVIVLCTSSMSVVQWRQEFLKWSNINPEDIVAFTSDNKGHIFTGNTGIIVTTYSMVTQTRERSHDAKKMMNFLKSREWGLMLLDEVHVVPANIFRKVTSNIKTHSKLGLTATLLREDEKISDLNFLIGPKLYEANWMELSDQGHIAKVQCAEVWCPMTTEFYEEYLKAPPRKRGLLYTMNPSKFQACQYLIDYHERRGDKIIVFSDNVYALKAYALKLDKPMIYGGTAQSERLLVLQNFQYNPQVNTVFLSKIGDTSLDLPEATCLIQISSHFGSRRQEAQRLGRILRAKRRNQEGFNAFFYSLVSKDTNEMYYSSRRQAFLVDQGYEFKVITTMEGMDRQPNLAFATPQERRELLAKVLVETEAGEEDEIVDDLFHSGTMGKKAKRKGVRRTAGTLGELSGGQDMAYIEQNKRNQAIKKGKAERSAFFKKIAREKEKRSKG
jgi:DNA excision repair protein ERCC-3